jgi:TATA-box binding protein (TBP) (component of TFIID and TFIIIB)
METWAFVIQLSKIRKKFTKQGSQPDPSWIRITTITMCSKLGENLDLGAVRQGFAKHGNQVTINGFPCVLKDTAFYNQITLNYHDSHSKKSIKVFPNGSVQVAGCSDPMDCDRCMNTLSTVLKTVLDREEFPVGTPSIKMINTNFSLNSSINLMKVWRYFTSDPMFHVTYEPSRYSAVKVKFVPGKGAKAVTASIFSTGKIIVTGAQTLEEIVQAYDILNTKIKGEFRVAPVENPEVFDNFMGASYGDWTKMIIKKIKCN